MKKIFIRLLITIVVGLLTYYVTLPAINLHYFGFYLFVCFIIIVFKLSGIISLPDKIIKISSTKRIDFKNIIKSSIVYMIMAAVFILIFIGDLVYSPLIMHNKYANRIVVKEDKSFEDNIHEVDFEMLPLLDKESSSKLGDRVMGQMSELVSQFEVSSQYTQINYNNKIVRVTPLEYASEIKWLTNRKEGIKGYITVNSVDGSSELIKLEKGMKYMPSAMFNENLYRKLRFNHPTKIFGKISFEIDNDGNPYWIVPTMTYKVVGLLSEVEGVIIFNPIDGTSKYYKVSEVPKWVDHVYDANLITEQFNDYGMYKNGFFNSIFGQKGVVQTTDGYNYMIQDDDVYLYTGVTSINSDESNIGFIITNLRTKETNFYNVPGAEEYSAMESAKGQVQQMNYNSTFPLLINLNSRPTYLISLKDKAGLVKMYAFVDVQDYQKVVVTDSSLGINEAARNYLTNVDIKGNKDVNVKKEITVKSINSATIDGVSYYYIVDTDDQKYKASIKLNDNLPFVRQNDKLNIKYIKEKNIIDIISIE